MSTIVDSVVYMGASEELPMGLILMGASKELPMLFVFMLRSLFFIWVRARNYPHWSCAEYVVFIDPSFKQWLID